MQSIQRWALVLVLQALIVQVQAGESYWVVLGSMGTSAGVDALVASASKLEQPVSTQQIDTARGTVHRIVVGPYDGQSRAQEVAASARGQGFADAWVVEMDQSAAIAAVTPTGSAPSSDSMSSLDALPAIDPEPESTPMVPAAKSGFDPIAPLTPDEEQQESTRDLLDQTKDEIPDTAPPGYSLNKLRRDS